MSCSRKSSCGGRFLWRLLWLSCRAKSRHLAVNPLSSVSPDGKQQRTARSLHSSRLPPSHFVLRRTKRRDSVGMTTSFAAAVCAPPLFAAAPVRRWIWIIVSSPFPPFPPFSAFSASSALKAVRRWIWIIVFSPFPPGYTIGILNRECACAQHPAEVYARHANRSSKRMTVFREKTRTPVTRALTGHGYRCPRK